MLYIFKGLFIISIKLIASAVLLKYLQFLENTALVVITRCRAQNCNFSACNHTKGINVTTNVEKKNIPQEQRCDAYNFFLLTLILKYYYTCSFGEWKKTRKRKSCEKYQTTFTTISTKAKRGI